MTASSVPVEFLFRLECDLSGLPAFVVNGGPCGTRILASVTSGTFAGPRIRGTLGPEASGDWVTVRPSGVWELDVRVALHTDDGVPVLFTYTGLGRPVDRRIGVRGVPRFECGDEKYAWLNDVQGVLTGEADPVARAVTYDVYALL